MNLKFAAETFATIRKHFFKSQHVWRKFLNSLGAGGIQNNRVVGAGADGENGRHTIDNQITILNLTHDSFSIPKRTSPASEGKRAPTPNPTPSPTPSPTPIPYSLNVQWRIAGNVFTSGKYAYSTDGGSTWTVGGPSDFIGSGLYGTAITINGLSNGQTILLGVLNNSNSNVTFGTGNGGGYTGFCGESSPYSVTISTPGTTTVYLNVAESTPGTLQTC